MNKSGLAAVAAAVSGAAADTTATEAVVVQPAAAAPVNDNKPSGAAAERARIGAIINAPEAKGRETLATHLAFETELSVEASIGMLKAAPVAQPAAAAASRLDRAMENFRPQVDVAEAGAADKDRGAALSAAVDRQLAKVGVKPRGDVLH